VNANNKKKYFNETKILLALAEGMKTLDHTGPRKQIKAVRQRKVEGYVKLSKS
jgi:hypothetical protein